ncbi:hypothetical protein BVH03_17695 [Pseudomonas sp. PA15(2017)]|uniref:hypothetical protein n=1 Tax=Pseudomonas sp. PA15(2017) TaxID=1932111 RepID=UPI000964A45A|nr:hypothetical protein [Pseudomonas sp. PA15(2017)]OLU25666.1 hypothetical protein BVH03_17695 [Pseudomonas sp. PA15(2017)]
MKAAITLYDALVSANVPTDKAKDVVEAWEKDMENLATKQDLLGLGESLKSDFKALLYQAMLLQTLTMAGVFIAVIKLIN